MYEFNETWIFCEGMIYEKKNDILFDEDIRYTSVPRK